MDRLNKKKVIITAIVTLVLTVAGMIFGITYTDNDIKEISEGIETVVNIVDNQSTTEIEEQTVEDEEALEYQETEAEGFKLQGEIAYEGSSEVPSVQLGEYAGLTYYSQIDSRWKDKLYTSTGNRSQTIGSSACGPTCAAMIVSSIKGTITPDTMADLYVKYGFRSASNGTYFSAFRWTADVFDIGYKEIYKLNDVCDLLEQNYMVITACGNGLFTTGGHFILIYGYEDTNKDGQCDTGDRLKVYDPYLYSGKFNLSTRRGKAAVNGNTVYVEKETFRAYANYSMFFAFKNDRTDIKENPTTITTVKKEENAPTNIIVKNTVGQTKKLSRNCHLYSNSNLTGIEYDYLKNTRVTVLENVSANIDKIRVNVTGRIAYINTSNYKEAVATVKNTVGQYKKFARTYTYIYSNSNLSGYKYYYLKNTKVKILQNVSTNVDRIYVPATRKIWIC